MDTTKKIAEATRQKGTTNVLKTKNAAGILTYMTAILIDKDGPLLDIKLQLHENTRRGFAKQKNLGTEGMDFPFLPNTTYRLRGIREDYNSGLKPILALMAINLWASKTRASGGAQERALKNILANPNPAERLDRLISTYVDTKAKKDIARDIYIGDEGRFFSSAEAANFIEPIKNAREAFLELEERYKGRIGIVTNTPTREILRRDLAIIFKTNEIAKIKAICRQDVLKPKPDPEGAHIIMDMVGAKPSETFMVGDTIVDIKMAQNAGVVPVGVLSGMASYAHLSNAGAAMIVDDISHLTHILRNSSDSTINKEATVLPATQAR